MCYALLGMVLLCSYSDRFFGARPLHGNHDYARMGMALLYSYFDRLLSSLCCATSTW